MSRSHEPHFCKTHKLQLRYSKALGTKAGSAGSRGPISEASPTQRAKVKGEVSIISAEGPCDPAHLWDRRLGGCDSADCVVPLTRREHRDFEEKRLDLLPALVAGGFWAEMAHVLTEHKVSPTVLVERLTGEPYGPTANLVRELDLQQARVVELESGIAA
jgi:hypothetical protein